MKANIMPLYKSRNLTLDRSHVHTYTSTTFAQKLFQFRNPAAHKTRKCRNRYNSRTYGQALCALPFKLLLLSIRAIKPENPRALATRQYPHTHIASAHDTIIRGGGSRKKKQH